MKYLLLLAVILIMANSWRYAYAAWREKNRFGAVGLVLFTLGTIALVAWQLFAAR
ncbi:MAG: hypothetical protein NUW23_13965 [Firmicutes bacterium]|nr:hypothetical protein [Bacillota bacterium]